MLITHNPITHEFTSRFWWTLEHASETAKILSAGGDVHNDPALYAGLKNQYITVIKGPPHDPSRPSECWALTNKYDPHIAEKSGLKKAHEKFLSIKLKAKSNG